MDFNEALLKIGLTPIEATLLTTLIKNGPLSGYEVAKLCGISRSNVYSALYSLQEKGKCHLIEGQTNKYIALTKEELLLNYKRECEAVYKSLDLYFPDTPPASKPYITITGYTQVMEKIQNTITLCASHLYILSTTSCIRLFDQELQAIASSKKVTLICDEPFDLPGATVYIKQKTPQGFHMIRDTQCVLTGELTQQAHCLYTHNQSLVRLMRESFITELDMIKLSQHL